MTKKTILNHLNSQGVKCCYQNTMFFVNKSFDIIAGMVIKASGKNSFYIDDGEVILCDCIPANIWDMIKW